PADIGHPDHDVPVNVNRGRQDDFRVGNKRGRTLRGGGAWAQIVVDVVEGAQVPVAGAMAPVIDDIVPEITLHRDIAPTRHAALHVGEEVVVPGAAVAAHTGREGMPLSVVAFRNDAPLHGVAVERTGGGQGFGVAPTARAMVNDEVVAVVSAEALGSELASVISRADTEEADDHIMRRREREGVPVALGLPDADAVARGRLAGDSDIGFPDCQTFGLDYAAYAEDHGAGSFRLNCFTQTARAGVV